MSVDRIVARPLSLDVPESVGEAGQDFATSYQQLGLDAALEALSLDELEAVIERFRRGFYEAGIALNVIRKKKLADLRALGYANFEDYVQRRWTMSRRHAYELMDAAAVVENLCAMAHTSEPTALPVTERQARALTRLTTPAQQAEAWDRAQELAEEEAVKKQAPPKPPTAAIVKQAVNEVLTGVVEVPVEVERTAFEQAFKPEYLNLWTGLKCDERFGVPHPGRMPGQFVTNLLWLYTQPGDLVLDPFAGGGSTIDACKPMGRRCLAFDLRPRRADIAPKDAASLAPTDLTDGPATLVFLDPPYWTQKRGEYTDNPADLSNLTSLADFYAAIEHLARIIKPLLDAERAYVALAISQSRVSGQVFDLAFESAKRFEYAGYRLVERIVTTYGQAASITGDWIARARAERFLLRAYRDILVFAP